MFEVGEADCHLIKYPYNKNTILIDTGKNEYKIKNEVIPYLKSIGIKKIDYLITSHGNEDHIGGSITLINNFQVKNVILNKGTFTDLEKELIKNLNKKKIPYQININKINISNHTIYLLNNTKYNNENDNSIVTYFEYQKYKFLFMGDSSSKTEEYLINNYIEELKIENKIEDFNIITYDLDDGINNILEDANTLSMFGNKKMIIVNNSYMFTSVKQEIDSESFYKYIDNPNPDCLLIFIVNNEKLDERKKITKQIKKTAIVKDFNTFDNNTIKKMFGDYKIDNITLEYLKDRVGKNLDILSQEIEKIKIYKDNDKTITNDDITKLTSKNIDVDIFTLIDSIVTKDKDKAMTIYNEMIKLNEEPIKIIVMLANQFRIMYQAARLYKKGYSGNDIAELLGIHPYRIKLALEKSRSYTEKQLINNLYSLAVLDEEIKTGKKDKYLALELFLLGV